MAITPLPPPPSRSVPANFSVATDAFLGALPGFVTQANALGAQATADAATAAAGASTATTQAGIATTQAAAASALVNVAKWVSGTTYAIGDCRWSPLNQTTYRRKTAGSGTTDPKEDTVNWGSVSPQIPTFAYDNRSSLRTLTVDSDSLAIVDGLGLFRFASGSDEPDDDESCFATPTGRWLMDAPHWDVVDSWQTPDAEARDAYDEDHPGRMLFGTASSAITSVSAISQASFTGTVVGAVAGDRVFATPPNLLGPSIAYFALVTANDTVAVVLNNPSAASQTLIGGVWNLLVIKEV